MTEDIRKKFNIELEIRNHLTNIESYAENVYNYLNKDSTIDKDEIIEYLKCIPESTEIIDKLIEKLEVIYENEQLQQIIK